MGTFLNEQRRETVRGDSPPQPVGGRLPPQDPDAEAAVLSAVLLSADAFDQVQETLRPEHFYADANRRIYEAVYALREADKPADMVTVATWLRDRNRLQQVGGSPYLAQLADATPAVANVEAHAETIREKWRVRQLIKTCQRFVAEGYGDYGDAQVFIDEAEQAVFEIARVPAESAVRPVEDAIRDMFNTITEVARRGGGITGIRTGFERLDQLCGGLREGDLYIVAGRPGMGKTALVLNLAVSVASYRQESVTAPGDRYDEPPVEAPGCGVVFFSLEMPREQLASRLLATEGRVDLSQIRNGNLKTAEWTKLTEAAARLTRLPLWIDDTPALTLMDMRAKIRRLQADLKHEGSPAGKLGLVVVDYLQLMQGRRDASSREQEISELSRGLKRLAKEMHVPIVALSQLNRAVETRTTKDKRPQLSDLRESGSIEQDADLVLFIYREDYYRTTSGAEEPQDQSQRGVAEIIIAKQRNGPTGKFYLKYTKAHTRFDNLDYGEFDQYDDYPEEGPDEFEFGGGIPVG
jgi:replicative DNA helicase